MSCMDRRTKGVTLAAIDVVEAAVRRPLGLGTMNLLSKLASRMLDYVPELVSYQACVKIKIK